MITYAGLEPITDNSNTTDRVITGTFTDNTMVITQDSGTGWITVESSDSTPSFETVSFALPSASLTIRGGLGDDEISFGTNLSTSGVDLVIESERIVVSNVTIDTGSGSLTLAAEDDGSGLLGWLATQVAGIVSLDSATYTHLAGVTGFISGIAAPIDVFIADAEVEVLNATLSGATVSVSAAASVNATSTFPVIGMLGVGSMATVAVDNSNLTSTSGDLTVASSSTVTTLVTPNGLGLSVLDAAGAVNVTADNTLNVTSRAKGTAGSGTNASGTPSAAGSVALTVLVSTNDAHIDTNDTINTADALADQTVGPVQYSNPDVSVPSVASSTVAYVADGAIVNTKGNVTIGADSFASVVSVAGAISGSGSISDATVMPNVRAYIGGSVNVTVPGNVLVTAHSEGDAEADANAENYGGVAVGITDADAWVKSNVKAYAGNSAHVSSTGGTITIKAAHNTDLSGAVIANRDADAYANATGGGFVSVQSATTWAKANADVRAYTGNSANLNGSGDVTVRAWASSDATASSNGSSLGVVGIGATDAKAYAGSSGTYIKAYLGDSSITAGDDVIVNLEAQATAGGI